MTVSKPSRYDLSFALSGARYRSETIEAVYDGLLAAGIDFVVFMPDATLDGTRKIFLTDLATVPLLIINDLGMRKLPHPAAEDL